MRYTEFIGLLNFLINNNIALYTCIYLYFNHSRYLLYYISLIIQFISNFNYLNSNSLKSYRICLTLNHSVFSLKYAHNITVILVIETSCDIYVLLFIIYVLLLTYKNIRVTYMRVTCIGYYRNF